MKVLLDENLPHDLRHYIAGHEVFTVAFLGWRGVGNGQLLAKAASAGFDVVVTMDSGIEHEQQLANLPVAVLIIRAASNTMDDLRPLVSLLLHTLSSIRPRTFVRIG